MNESSTNLTTYTPPSDLSPKKHLWFIHGANASQNSFNFIKADILKSDLATNVIFKNINYDCQDNLLDIVSLIADAAAEVKGDLYLVGHSLGGVIAVAVSQRLKSTGNSDHVRGVFTMSAPFGGVESADYLRWVYPHFNLFKNVSTHNSLIKDLGRIGAVVPTLSIVSTSGNNPLFPNSNDGVVSTKSQRALPNSAYVECATNHFEVLLDSSISGKLIAFVKDISL